MRVWDLEGQDCLQTLIGHTAEVCSCTYDRHGSILATGSSDKTVRLWDARQKNRSFQTLRGHKASVYSVAFRRESFDLLATASQDGTVAVWDPRNWKCAQVLREHAGEVVGLAWHPQGSMLTTGSADMTVHLHPIRGTPPEPHEYTEFSFEEEQAPLSLPDGLASSKSTVPSSPMLMEVTSQTLNGGGEGVEGGRALLGVRASVLKKSMAGESTATVDLSIRRQLEVNCTCLCLMHARVMACGSLPCCEIRLDDVFEKHEDGDAERHLCWLAVPRERRQSLLLCGQACC